MIASYPNRRFQLWEYTVSHGVLLVRSPISPLGPDGTIATNNIDLFFVDVIFISAPRFMDGVTLEEGNAEDIKRAETLLNSSLYDSSVFVLNSGGCRHWVVAAYCKVDENEMDLFENYFSFRTRPIPDSIDS
jgi:hypothetical protein